MNLPWKPRGFEAMGAEESLKLVTKHQRTNHARIAVGLSEVLLAFIALFPKAVIRHG